MPIDVIMPKVDMVMDAGTIARWHKAEGDTVRAGEALFDLETDKATMEVEAPASGTLTRITAQDGATVPVATVIALIVQAGEQLGQPEPPTPAPVSANPRPRATPLARSLARQHGVDLTALVGGGPQGRIRKDDVLTAISAQRTSAPGNGAAPALAQPAPTSAPATPTVLGPPVPVFARPDEQSPGGRLLALAGARKIIAQRLAISAGIPQFALTVEVDLSAANDLRARLPYRPSITAILARVVAALLPRHPTLNASFREDGIWLHTPVHLGIALDRDGDLLVPVIRDAHQRTLGELAAALVDMRKRAEARQLMPGELQGSTFSISNLGMLGVDQFTALVNPPEAAILAVGRSARRPVEQDGSIMFKPMLTLTLSADHRVTDGAAAARFLQDVRAALEEPLLLL
jgi:pyruvate dehydrogenase E2 component (dihydrolipoamide acetyltransferase)